MSDPTQTAAYLVADPRGVTVFAQPTGATGVVTVLRCGETVFATGARDGDWVEVHGGALAAGGSAERGDRGWVPADRMRPAATDEADAHWLRVHALTALGFEEATRKRRPALVTLPTGAWVRSERVLRDESDNDLDRGDWRPCELADGRSVWVQAMDLVGGAESQAAGEDRPDEADLVSELMRFLGRPYVWGGSDSAGMDCSGLVMHAARWLAERAPGSTTPAGGPDRLFDGHRDWLPHSARRQFLEDWPSLTRIGADRLDAIVSGGPGREDWRRAGSVGHRLASEAAEAWGGVVRPGDVVYFAMGGRRVNHVGVVSAVGQEADASATLLHASSASEPAGPSVKLERLWSGDASVFENGLAMQIVGVRRFVGLAHAD